MLRRLPTLALCTLLAAPAAAQVGFGPPSHASAELFVRTDDDRVQAVLRIEVDEGWHLYHDELGPEDAVGMPTTVVLDALGVDWDPPMFPEPERYEQLGLGDDGGDTWIWGHHGEFVVRATGALEGDAPEPGDVMAEIEGLTCEENGQCVPYRATVTGAGRGPDALFAAFADPAGVAGGPQAEGAGGGGAASFGGGGPGLGFGLGGPPRHASARLELAEFDGGGERLVLGRLLIEIEEGWHLYHDELGPEDAIGVPTTLEFDGLGLEFGAAFGEPERLEQPGLGDGGRDTWILAHEGTLRVVVRAELPDGIDFDPAAITVAVDGLTCEDDGTCVPYRETVTGEPWEGARPEVLAAALEAFEAPAEGASADAGRGGVDEEADGAAEQPEEEDDGLVAFLSLAVFWGLFTLLMPCTYPMIPITISFFTKQAEARGGNVLPLSLTYGAGIVGIFVGIGLLVGPAIIAFATDPLLNLIIGLAFFYFALVLFGAINLNPPRFLMDAAGKASNRGGLVGVFLMGATLVVTSFTCTAPFVGSLLSVGSTGESASLGRIALGMGTFGATIAVPFVLLSLLPGRLQAIPRAGQWMNTLKVSLGFVELAAALKFISNADLVWGWEFLSRELFLVLWMGIFLAAALYLFGFVRLKGESGEIGPGRLVAALGFLLFGLYLGYGATGRQLDRVMTAIEPPYSGAPAFGSPPAAGGEGGAGASPAAQRGHTIVVDDYAEAKAAALAQDKLLMVNFTGHTCVNCRQMERLTFPSAVVAAELEPYFVEARLHTDDPALDFSGLQRELGAPFANPFYVLLDPESGERLADGSYMTRERFAGFLRDARRAAGRG